jgi:hypothetical protein
MSTTAPSAILTRIKVKPFGVRQSALLLKEYSVNIIFLLAPHTRENLNRFADYTKIK